LPANRPGLHKHRRFRHRADIGTGSPPLHSVNIGGMNKRAKPPIGRDPGGLVAVSIVFALAILMVLKRYDPAVITAVVTGTSLAAAELVRRLRESASGKSDRDREGGS
jgi:hypothetical protein